MIEVAKGLKEDLVRITQEMIRIPSITGNEKELAELILRRLVGFGIKESFIDDIGNVVSIIRGGKSGINILLNGHLDIVPVGNIENWEGYDPFGAEIDDQGNIHGRGAADLKGGLSVQIYIMKLLKSLRDRGISFPGNVIFSAVVHEEAAEMFGMEYLCKKTLPEKKLDCDVVFLCEPTGLNVILGQRGKVEIVVKTKGKTAHSSVPTAGINALEKMVPILDRIFNKMSKKMGDHSLLGNESITVTNLICRPGVLSIIPDECEISIDRRYMPSTNIKDLLIEFKWLFEKIKKSDPQFVATVNVRKVIERSYTGYEKKVQKYHPPWITDENNPFVKKTLLALKKIGQEPKIGYWQFGTDGSLTASLLGIPTIGYSGMEERFAHTPEEMVNIQMMMKSLEGYFSIICELFGFDVNDLSLLIDYKQV